MPLGVTYSSTPSTKSRSPLSAEWKALPGLVRGWRQAEPARRLPNLAKVPILILVAEASHAAYDHCTAAYLAQATNIANFILNHPRLPADKIPYWDFDAPGIPDAPRDASAAAVMSSALIELSGIVGGETGGKYLSLARQQLLSLSSPAYRAKPGENGNFILMHCTGNLPAKSEVDVPLNYADYYYLEALLRYRARMTVADGGAKPVEAHRPWPMRGTKFPQG